MDIEFADDELLEIYAALEERTENADSFLADESISADDRSVILESLDLCRSALSKLDALFRENGIELL